MRRLIGVLAAVSAVFVSLVVAGGVAGAAVTASLALSKNVLVAGTDTPLTDPVTQGQSFDYQLSAACSGLTQGCINATTVDIIPADVDIQVPPSLPPLYTVASSPRPAP